MSDWRANFHAALAARDCKTTTEWVERFPGEHCWFDFKGTICCALCGHIQRADGKPNKPCRGIVRIELR